MDRADIGATVAFLVLAAATVSSFWAAEHLANPAVAIAAIMAIAAVKVLIVLKRFMELDQAAVPFRVYFHLWTIGCAAMIFDVAWLAMM